MSSRGPNKRMSIEPLVLQVDRSLFMLASGHGSASLALQAPCARFVFQQALRGEFESIPSEASCYQGEESERLFKGIAYSGNPSPQSSPPRGEEGWAHGEIENWKTRK